MRTFVYGKRNIKELFSDPVNLIFTIGLPVFLLLFMVTFNNSLQINESFEVENFVPSTIVFSFTFLTMFSGMLIAKDRSSEFLTRMYVSPLKAHNYILGYMWPVLLIALIQIFILYGVGIILGMGLTIHTLISIPVLLIIAMIFIGLGLVFGSLLKDSQVGGITSILIQVVAFTSGMWFSLDLVGGVFKTISQILPFAHSVDIVRYITTANYSKVLLSFIVVVTYALISIVFAIFAFRKNMKN